MLVKMAFWQTKSFQNLSNYVNSELESLHDFVMVWLVVIMIVVLYLSYGIISSTTSVSMRLDSMMLEVTWTLAPMFILISIAIPSISLLCLQDTLYLVPGNTVKIMSSQWNWQTEQSNEQTDHLLDLDKLDELCSYEFPAVLPLEKINRILLTSSDVLHSLGVPSLGIKLDSTPGRLNALTLELMAPGLLTGSCYELCGSGHSAMPLFVLVM